jgi:UDP-GlcNAc:undecaprenyl-phosphate/decaprenyl-phosphate GlcNAc-1-phosphate transferase
MLDTDPSLPHNGLLVAFAVGIAVCLLLLVSRHWHLRFTGDSRLDLPQKIHSGEIPRIGGLAIVLGFVAGIVHETWFAATPAISEMTASVLLVALAPVALIGFAEDLTQRVVPPVRLYALGFGAAVAILLLELALDRINVPGLDHLFAYRGFAVVFSIFACVGAANAYNIIDGLNGLLAGVALISLAAIASVAAAVGDSTVLTLAALLGAATIAYVPFNWPRARLFAGDGGAYSLGFLIAALLLLLVSRNPTVSPWFGLTAAALPIWETVYSMWRRTRSGVGTMAPDQSHLHQLVRSRLLWTRRCRLQKRMQAWISSAPAPMQLLAPGSLSVRAPNGSASPVLWVLHASAAGLGALAWDDTGAQMMVMAGFGGLYTLLHRRLCRSRIKYGLVPAAG